MYDDMYVYVLNSHYHLSYIGCLAFIHLIARDHIHVVFSKLFMEYLFGLFYVNENNINKRFLIPWTDFDIPRFIFTSSGNDGISFSMLSYTQFPQYVYDTLR